MAFKCIRKLVVVMMELLILILLKVQANDFAHTSFCPSSHPIVFPYFSKLDKVQNNVLAPTSSFFSLHCPSFILNHLNWMKIKKQYTCIAKQIKFCEEKHTHNILEFGSCIWSHHLACTEEHLPDMNVMADICVLNCVEHPSDIGSYVKECYEKHFKDSDVVYAQNS